LFRSQHFSFQLSTFQLFPVMSYLSIALQRRIERRQMNQSDLAKQSGISRSYISRLFSGEAHELSDANFTAILNVFAADPQAQADIIAARCIDTLEVARAARTPGSELVEISVKGHTPAKGEQQKEFPDVELSHQTERAFAWLRSQCPLNPELEKHLVGYARLTGMP
jgi:transcriptional regulator with XRE-family HTH domain